MKLYNPSSTTTVTKGIYIIESSLRFRVDYCHIENIGRNYGAGVYIDGTSITGVGGVIDHCYIKPQSDSNSYGIVFYGGNWWPHEAIADRDDFYDNLSTYQPLAVYAEDNTFVNCRHAIASNHGSYYVFRYNEIQGGHISTSGRIDAHGWKVSASYDGSRFVEVYENHVLAPGGAYSDSAAIWIRGGDGVVYNNYCDYDYCLALSLEEEQANVKYQDRQLHRVYAWNNTGYHNAEMVVSNGIVASDVAITIDDNVGDDDAYNEAPGDARYPNTYSAYTYPHPLVTATPPVVTPSTVRNLRVPPSIENKGGQVLRINANETDVEWTVIGSNKKYSSTASVTHANSTTETSLFGAGVGSITIPLNTLQVGDVISISMSGIYSSKAAPVGTISFAPMIGGSDITTVTGTFDASQTNQQWEAKILLSVRTIGSTGTLQAQGRFMIQGSTYNMWGLNNTSTTTIDTTSNLNLDVTADWATANASNSITCTNSIIEIIR